jgi:hypothetical protein
MRKLNEWRGRERQPPDDGSKKTNGNMIDGDTIVNMLPSFLALLDKDLIRF